MQSSFMTAGHFIDGFYADAYGTRAYKLYIPSGAIGQAPALLVMLHGCYQNPDDFAAGTRMNTLAETGAFLIVYPGQPSSANISRCWNWFRREDQQRGAGEPALLAGLTRQIMATYRVDASRVFIAGMSAGAAMSVILAASYPDLYAAVGVHSGLAYAAAHDLDTAYTAMQHGSLAPARPESRISAATGVPTRVVPTIVFHGDRDRTVSVVNADHVLTPWVPAPEERDTTHRPDQRVRVERGQEPGGYAYTRSIYHDPQGRALMEKWIVHQMGHAWSGGSARGSYSDPRGPNASAEMVRFFGEHPHGWAQRFLGRPSGVFAPHGRDDHVACVLDTQVLAALQDLEQRSRAGLLARLITLYLRDTPAQLAALHEAVAHGAADQVEEVAHGLSGSSVQLGATRMAGLCTSLHEDASTHNLSRAAARVADLTREFCRVQAALEAVLRQTQPHDA